LQEKEIVMAKQVFGYVRVSTAEQNDARQRDALAPCGIPRRNLYADKQSGKDFERPAYKRLIKRLRPGDLVIVKSIDRLGRDYGDIIEQWRFITREKGADIRVLDMPLLDTTYCKDLLGTFISDLVLSVMSFSAQLERENILSRQAEGIASAKTRGVHFGPPPKPLPENFHALFTQWRSGDITNAAECAALCGFSRRTLFRRLKKMFNSTENYTT
jgi:DNA invertase Pin-like site-specific DNA recombinase